MGDFAVAGHRRRTAMSLLAMTLNSAAGFSIARSSGALTSPIQIALWRPGGSLAVLSKAGRFRHTGSCRPGGRDVATRQALLALVAWRRPLAPIWSHHRAQPSALAAPHTWAERKHRHVVGPFIDVDLGVMNAVLAGDE